MSKQRALELCDQADVKVSQYTSDAGLGPLARSVQNCIDSIRELAKDGPNKPDANLDDLLTELQGVREEIRQFKDCVMSLAPPPKSDPPGPT